MCVCVCVSLVQVVDNCSELRPAAMETLCCLMVQLNQRYKIFIPMVKKVSGCGHMGVVTLNSAVSPGTHKASLPTLNVRPTTV